MNLVALPIAIGKVPVTSGSRVPVCPTFLYLVTSSLVLHNHERCSSVFINY